MDKSQTPKTNNMGKRSSIVTSKSKLFQLFIELY